METSEETLELLLQLSYDIQTLFDHGMKDSRQFSSASTNIGSHLVTLRSLSLSLTDSHSQRILIEFHNFFALSSKVVKLLKNFQCQ